MLIGGGGGGSMYAVQIESLETFQQKLTAILQGLEQDNSVMTMNDGSSSFGDFPEAQAFAAAYEQTKQDLINSFNEVTQLVNTMINVVGTNASKYRETEQEITSKFNTILQQYGDAPMPPVYTPGSSTGTSGTTYYPQTYPQSAPMPNTAVTYAPPNPGSGAGPVGGGGPASTNTGSGSGSNTSAGAA